ncbi:hypothetical protein [Streptomyces himalayensis]|uniref:hypothetical protein n=1 Tax=Streptomyces himalayensis TaxID=2820085 RepID=UPI0028683776|nr:hypothetical protein [Streptomyces himalayensis]
MWDGPFYRVKRDEYEICFVPGAGEDLDEVCNVDMWVTFASGNRWSGTVLTLDEVRHLMDRWKNTGECLDGGYFYCYGLIVREAGIPAMVRIVDDLVATGDYQGALRPLGREDDQDD